MTGNCSTGPRLNGASENESNLEALLLRVIDGEYRGNVLLEINSSPPGWGRRVAKRKGFSGILDT